MTSLRSERLGKVAGGVVVGFLTLLTMAPWWRGYVAGTVDGSTLHFGMEIARGRVPYRDFWIWTPPLHALESALLYALFGANILVEHLFGAACRIVMTVALYRWLRSLYPGAISIVASVATVAVFNTGDTDTLFYYTQQAIFYAVLAGATASHALQREDAGEKPGVAWWVAGALAGCSAMTKQTIGGAVVLALVLACATPSPRPRDRRAVLRSGALLAGVATPVILIAAWLAKEGALAIAITSLRHGTSSKGPLFLNLTRVVTVFGLDPQYSLALGIALGAVVIALMTGPRSAPIWRRIPRPLRGAAVVAPFLFAAVLVGWKIDDGFWFARAPQLACVELGLWGSLAGTVYHAVRILRGDVASPRRARFHLALASFGMAYATSLSWGANEFMAYPSFAYVLCEAAGMAGERGIFLRARAAAAIGVAVLGIAMYAKIRAPFSWMGWVEPPAIGPVRGSPLEPLTGMEMSWDTAAIYEHVTEAIQAHSGPGDPIFVFPVYQIFYVLADRPAATFAPIDFWDVVPDDVAEADAQRILATPPKVMVVLQMSTRAWDDGERFFRGGHRCAQRDIMESIEKLAPRYSLIERVEMPGSRWPLLVMARRDELPSPR